MSIDLASLPRMVFGSATAARTDLAAQDAAIRAPLSTTRRIGFLSLTAHPAVPDIAVRVVRAVASRRAEPVLAVDVTDEGRFAGALGIAGTVPSETRATARTTAEAVAGLEERDGIVGLRPDATGDTVGAWLAEAAPITRFFDVAVTDFGPHHPLTDLSSCVALCDVVALVTDGSRAAVENARAVLPAVSALPERPAPVLVLASAQRGDDADTAAVARAVRATAGHPVVAIPAAARTARRALLQLAAILVSGGRPIAQRGEAA